MLNDQERGFLKDAEGNSDIFLSMVHYLLDNDRIVDLPEAERVFLSGCEVNRPSKQTFLRASCLVGPITHRYILPGLAPRLSKAEKAFPKWSIDPTHRYADRILEAMTSGDTLKAEADKIIQDIRAFAE